MVQRSMATHPVLDSVVTTLRSLFRKSHHANGGTVDVLSPNARLDKDLRGMVRQSLSYGPELMIENLWRGMPVFPIIDELIGICVGELRSQTARFDITPRSTVSLKFPCGEPMEIERKIMKHVVSQFKDVVSDPFYLDVIFRAPEWELVSTVTVLYDLHFSLVNSTGKIVIED